MAESANVLGPPDQTVLLPDLAAGCSMADMAAIDQLEICWQELPAARRRPTIVPVTYINSAAAIKAFCGEHGGVVCTSSNAAAVDGVGVGPGREDADAARPASRPEHRVQMGVRSTRWSSGIRTSPSAASTRDAVARAPASSCGRATAASTRASPSRQIEQFRAQHPGGQVIVHPEVHVRRRAGGR